jgi:hypothetical protein
MLRSACILRHQYATPLWESLQNYLRDVHFHIDNLIEPRSAHEYRMKFNAA